MNFRDFLNISKICDAHIHLADLYDLQAEFTNSPSYMCISCSHSQKEFMLNEKIKNASDSKIISAFGIHPQKPDLQNAEFLEELAKSSKIAAVGECGFDLFTPEFKSHLLEQTEAFLMQTELAVKYNLPLIIHGRKCLELFFKYKKELSKVPAVIFHSFMGTYSESVSLLKSGINGLFSFSAQILKGNKKAIECVKNLPPGKLVFETDAPYQTLKGEKYTPQERILDVYLKAYKIRHDLETYEVNEKSSEFFEFVQLVNSNFDSVLKQS